MDIIDPPSPPEVSWIVIVNFHVIVDIIKYNMEALHGLMSPLTAAIEVKHVTEPLHLIHATCLMCTSSFFRKMSCNWSGNLRAE